ncbi:MAG: leucine-rich repeat domain-containing protein [Promethearchaeota archaeon]|jgi:Leucine-rich repeat (LRR) protein
MIELDPNKIYEDLLDKKIDKSSAINKLVVIIENSNNVLTRFNSIQILAKIGENFENTGISKEILFKLFENLMLSDSSEKIRNIAAKTLGDKFLEDSLNPMKWALQHEQSPLCLNTIFQTLLKITKNLGELNNRLSKFILIHEVKQIPDKEFKIGFENIIEKRGFNNITNHELYLILLNYFSITYMRKTIWRLNYTIENCKVIQLDFQFKGLIKVPDAVQYLDSLKTLSLRYNQITTIPEWIKKLKYLETINLNVNTINQLPESIGSLSYLKKLYLWKNDLETLPDSICNLKALKILNLRINQLKELPLNIGNLKNLCELNLHDNKLYTLPNSISELTSLEKLNLSWNLFQTIPNSLNSLSKLKILDLERNELSYIPETIGKLEKLEMMNLSDNKLSTIPKTIGMLNSLNYLNLSRNNIEHLPESLISITSLKELNLTDNKLKEVPAGLKKLEENGLIIHI